MNKYQKMLQEIGWMHVDEHLHDDEWAGMLFKFDINLGDLGLKTSKEPGYVYEMANLEDKGEVNGS